MMTDKKLQHQLQELRMRAETKNMNTASSKILKSYVIKLFKCRY